MGPEYGSAKIYPTDEDTCPARDVGRREGCSMVNRLNVSGLGDAAFDTADEDRRMTFQQTAVQSLDIPGEPQPAAARTPGPSWDDEEDWQRFFL